jgi:quinol monooxygenase YgiN
MPPTMANVIIDIINDCQFLDYISKIAPVTLANEPDCIGYAWFRSAGDNDAVPSHWLRGFEM